MGGTSDAYGNMSPVGEYNIWADPESARIVFGSGLPITMVGWDISRKYAVFDEAQAAELRAVGTPLAEFCIDIQGTVASFVLDTTQLEGFDLPDPIAMAVALDPDVATDVRRLYLDVEIGDGLCRGQTVVDNLGMSDGTPNIDVVFEASREKFLEILYAAVRA
jgi:purine nucleosidase